MHHRAGWLDPVFEGLSRVGSYGAIWILLALAFAVVWRRWGVLVLTTAAVAISDLAAGGLKQLFGEERPSTRYALPKPLVHAPRDSSFPSGHAATSFAAATVLTTFVPRLAPLWFLLALAIGFSRIYVGVHYPLDIAGGAALGVATALLLLAADRRRSRGARRTG